MEKEDVLGRSRAAVGLEAPSIQEQGWLMDVLMCVNQIRREEFSLSEMYACEDWLQTRHPNNRNIRAKIRQELQELRDSGHLVFLGNGHYRKIR